MIIQERTDQAEYKYMLEIDRYLSKINETQKIIDTIDVKYQDLIKIHEDSIKFYYERIESINELITCQRDLCERYIKIYNAIG